MPAEEHIYFAEEPVEPVREIPRRVPPVIGRTPPHSLEAEEYLLSNIFIDAEDVLPRCAQAGVTAASWYLPAHRMFFECAEGLHAKRKAVDIATIGEQMKTDQTLEAAGGYAKLTALAGRVPTTAQAGYMADKVRELQLLRETIGAATSVVEDAYNFSGGIDQFLEQTRERIDRIRPSGGLNGRMFDIGRKVEKPDPVFTLNKTVVCTPGNLTTIIAQSKAGKSSGVGGMIGASMSNSTAGHDTLGFYGPNFGKEAVIYVDTEMSPFDFQQMIMSILRRVGLEKPPAWFIAATLTGLPAPECRMHVERLLRQGKKLHGAVKALFLDGVGDLVIDPNDSEECFPLVTRLHALAIEYNTAIINVLHQNPGSDVKGRGHLGSQLERKSESNLTMEKDGEITRLWATKQRGKMILKDDAVAFQWSDEKQMHITVKQTAADCAKPGKKAMSSKYTFSELRSLFSKGTAENPLPLQQAHRGAGATKSITVPQLAEIARQAVADGLLKSDDRGFWL